MLPLYLLEAHDTADYLGIHFREANLHHLKVYILSIELLKPWTTYIICPTKLQATNPELLDFRL